jgi:hypothetical protein
MRCPKCGYVSFDSNQVCPKCNKDISTEQAKLNLPAFKPEPPALLGALIGEADESNMGMGLDHAADGETSNEGMQIDDEALAAGGEESDFDDSDELEITLESDEAGDEEMLEPLEEPLIAADSETSLEDSLSDFEFESSAFEEAVPEKEGSVGLAESSEDEPDGPGSAKMEELTLDAGEEGQTGSLETSPEEGEELAIELDELSFEESPAADDDRDAGGVAAKGPEKDETVLSLDELKINDTGELEIKADFNTAPEGGNEASAQGESSSPQATAASPVGGTQEDVVELEDLTLDELTFDQSEISEPKAQDQDQDPVNDPGVETIDFEELPLDDAFFSGRANLADDEGTVDLENLDLELDLGELERK